MFALCEGMRWNHLPVSGGLYDQNPQLIDRFYFILAEKSKHEAAEAKKREQETTSKAGRKGRRR